MTMATRKPPKKPSIYALVHPDTGELRYIGKADRPAVRLASHMRDARRRRTPVYDWIRSLGTRPDMVVLEESCEDWQDAERRWIGKARAAGARILNLADGGDQPKCSAETAMANAKAMNAKVEADPRRKRARELNRLLGYSLKRGTLSDNAKATLRLCAEKCPELFGMWANV